MIKKILTICLTFLIIGCTNGVSVKKGDSKTYLFFKDFDTSNYYVSFWDRNTSINDDTKIIMARNGDKYYYEFDGYERNVIIQKGGKCYNINPKMGEYYTEEKEVEDFSIGILPDEIKNLKKQKYETGKEKIFNKNYVYEKFSNKYGESTYYFKGDKLIYVRYKSVQNTVLLKFNYMKKASLDIFELGDNLEEITY